MRVERTFGKFFTSSVAALCLACLPACSLFKSKASEPEPAKPAESGKPAETAPVATIVPEAAEQPAKTAMPDDGLRLPDMLTMPQDNELKAAASAPTQKPSEPAPVVARPPADAVVKPKAEEPTPE
jgi:curli biogenesis system outer membrane secretion channel CsgG